MDSDDVFSHSGFTLIMFRSDLGSRQRLAGFPLQSSTCFLERTVQGLKERGLIQSRTLAHKCARYGRCASGSGIGVARSASSPKYMAIDI